MSITKFKAEVVSNKIIAPYVHFVTFGLLDPREIDFNAGQYATYLIDEHTRRTYSFCSPPEKKNQTSICVDTTPQGNGSHWLDNLKVGTRINFLAPLGHFCLHKDSFKDKIFIATGTGISPIRSMIKDFFMTALNSSGLRVTLLLGARTPDRLLFLDEWRELAERFNNFTYQTIVSRPILDNGGWSGRMGRVNLLLADIPLDQRLVSEYYLCGNHNMINDVKEILIGDNISPADIYHEQFY